MARFSNPIFDVAFVVLVLTTSAIEADARTQCNTVKQKWEGPCGYSELLAVMLILGIFIRMSKSFAHSPLVDLLHQQ